MTLQDLYDERVPLYEKYADLTVDETGRDAGAIVDVLRDYFEKQMCQTPDEAMK